ncbi:HD family phosphohydrolase [Clostridium estertheticum]|uniref:HD family phosphohydrolase n=1 Tax=Clostridium estertheticum TaxID=238834 RepID=UPI001CF4AF37|nr:HD family phosphohydrolase [Clostridium estertheticum]MCB2306598.1 HD family phosphohydrolase [Clostridium estertheticum]MCB2345186.1 HD family phosphohydrolase [Clostridium estertheticum]MCB2350040.1 HD family phosphohydrolase [Clostridium estertheticum]WAG44366.1 HD family phosphohydrolase [Clostridium estertheticum]
MRNIREIIKLRKTKPYIIFIVTTIIMYSILVTALVPKKYTLTVGDIAKADIKAPREVENEKLTKSDIYKAIEKVGKKTIKVPVNEKAIENIDKLFSTVSKLNAADANKAGSVNNEDLAGKAALEKEKITSLKKSNPISNFTYENYQFLINLELKQATELEKFIEKTMTTINDITTINENKPEEIIMAKGMIATTFINSNFPKNIREIGIAIANVEVRPNTIYDKASTDAAIKEAEKNIKPVIIKKDQIIIKEGEPITSEQMSLLESLGLLNSTNNFDWSLYLSLAALVCFVILLQWFYLYKYHPEIYYDTKKLIMLNILSIIAILLARVLGIISIFVIPLACVPMLMAILSNEEISIVLNVFNCILISVAVNFNFEITILAVLNSIVGVMLLKKMQQRNDILYSSLYIAMVNLVIYLSMGFLLSNSIMEVFKKAGLVYIAGLVAGTLTIGFLPFFESFFDIVTTVKLLELSNPNHPLLKRLLLEAPGSYHHSVLVANLSEVAAEVVGANPVLARACAYYHDIGKIKRPYFFKENQLGNDNPHDKITPNLSTLIIISHVKDGLELAKEYKLPKVIQDVIVQHHGTTLVKYFYVTMKNSSENPDEIKEEDFRYNGPNPESKEAAIIMLADAVEAAVRSIQNSTKGKIEEMVNNLIKARLNDGQLDNCNLTLKDLEKIRKSFLKVLSGIYHERIEYPLDKWEKDKSCENRRQVKEQKQV